MFIKKPLLKEDIAEGFEAVIEALPKKKEPKQKLPNGKPNGIVLEGADRYCFVHY